MIKHSIIYFIGKLLPAIINLIAISVYTRMVTPDEYGLFSIILVTGGVLNILFFQWIRSSLLRYINNSNEYRGFYETIIALEVILSFLILAITLVLKFIINLPTVIVTYVILFIIINSIFELLHMFFRAKLKPKTITFTLLVKSISTFTVSFLLLKLNMGTQGLVIGALSGFILSIIGFSYFFKKSFNEMKSLNFRLFNLELTKKFLMYGLPITLSFALGAALQNIDKLMLTVMLGLKQNGIYSVSFDIVHNLIYMIMTSVSLAGFPLVLNVIKNQGEKKGKLEFENYSKLLLFISVPVTFGFIGVAKEFTGVFIDNEFHFNESLIVLIALASLFHGIKSFYFDQALQISTKTRYFFVPALIAILTNITLNYFLLPLYGVNGAAFSTLVAFFISMVFSFVYSKRSYHYKIPYKDIIKCILSSLVMLLFITKINITNIILSLTLKVLCGISIYTLLSLLFNTVDIRGYIRKKSRTRGLHL